MEYDWVFSSETVDWDELAHLYQIAPLGSKGPEDLKICFTNSRYCCFVYDKGVLIGAGRALADGIDCSYIADLAVHPDYQGTGIGRAILSRLMELSKGHRKIFLYAAPGKEGFYHKAGFRRMTTAMALFEDQEAAFARGLLEAGP
jgi:ribosomal protein S18 acetylase RimI-like enzyme